MDPEFMKQFHEANQKRTKFDDACFDQRVQELKAYRDTNGHCGVPARYEPNKGLGHWVNSVRTQYKWRGQGKKNSLTDARISELDKLGFVWNGNEGYSRDVWMQRVEELIEYRNTNGHCQVPARHKPNKALGWWVNKVRSQYTGREQGKKNSLTDAHISELDSLGFVWKAGTRERKRLPRDEVWKKRVQDLTAYRDLNGHCRVPNLYKPNKSLGKWVNKVRTQYTWRGQGKWTSLTDARISELDGLGFVWKAGAKKKEGSPRDEVSKKRVQELTAFNNKYLETYPLNPLILHKQTEELLRKQTEELLHKQTKELLHKQTEELLQKLLLRRRDYDLYLWALRSYPL